MMFLPGREVVLLPLHHVPPPPLAAQGRAIMGVPHECLEVDSEAATEGAGHGHGSSVSCVGKLFNSSGKSCINLIETLN